MTPDPVEARELFVPEQRTYLPPVCGVLRETGGLSCYLSLYHPNKHEAPDPTTAVDSGRTVSWSRGEKL